MVFFKSPMSLSYRLYYFIGQAKEIFTFYADYQVVKLELEKLRFQANEFEEARLENNRLHEILEFQQQADYEFVVAQVIGKEPTNWLSSLIINKGSNHGIEINQTVMHFSGVIGKIIEVSPITSKVLLISDVNSRVVALVQRTRMEGILEGIGNGLCRLKYLPPDADLNLNDVVITSGLGGVYPKGLIIGCIESIRMERGGIYKSCIVKPFVVLSALEEVLCLKLDLRL
ncbi:MAG: rod shape-determining protein MreC [Candidatus Omnitrophica bacterium]|nr:rod shape-determining protein MreC [Candidatus Omnitrophota bacterium]